MATALYTGLVRLEIQVIESLSVDTIDLLVNFQANLNLRSYNLDTPLHMAAKFGRVDAVNILLKKYNIKCQVWNAHHQTPFDLAGCPVESKKFYLKRLLPTGCQRKDKTNYFRGRSIL